MEPSRMHALELLRTLQHVEHIVGLYDLHIARLVLMYRSDH